MTLLTKSQGVALLEGQAPPRILHAPRVRDNAWEDVSDLVAAYGLTLDQWQEEVLRAGLGERSDGRWAARQVGVSAPRQQGKTMLIVARVLAGLLLFDEKVIIVSAHRQDTARETFFRLVQIIEDNPKLEERVDFIARSEMREFIRMKSGQEVRFKARTSSSGRGFSCDCLMLDEAQILSTEAWAAILPTMSARPNPQVWLMGTPPTPADDGEVFGRIRNAGIDGSERTIAYLEWSAAPDDDFDDPRTWAKANPAFGGRISMEAIESERASMGDEQFAMERLGMWADAAAAHSALDLDLWEARKVAEASPDWQLAAVGVDMDKSGRAWLAIAAHADEPVVHVELTPVDPLEQGIDAAVALLWQMCKRRRPVVLPADSGAAVLEPALRAKQMSVYRLSPIEMVQASMSIAQAMKDKTISHLDDAVLAQGVRESSRVGMKGSQWRLGRDGEQSGAPIQAVACAHMGAVKWAKRRSAEPVGRNRQRVERTREVMGT